jgi:hypothetical protein
MTRTGRSARRHWRHDYFITIKAYAALRPSRQPQTQHTDLAAHQLDVPLSRTPRAATRDESRPAFNTGHGPTGLKRDRHTATVRTLWSATIQPGAEYTHATMSDFHFITALVVIHQRTSTADLGPCIGRVSLIDRARFYHSSTARRPIAGRHGQRFISIMPPPRSEYRPGCNIISGSFMTPEHARRCRHRRTILLPVEPQVIYRRRCRAGQCDR